MATYYDQNYWSLSEKERLLRARENYLGWKRIVDQSRKALSRKPWTAVIDSGSRYVDVWGHVTETKPTTITISRSPEAEGIHRRQYLADYKRYMMALLEYERLKRSANSHDTHVRPTATPLQPGADQPRGPAGVDQRSISETEEHDALEELRRRTLEKLRQSIERARRLKTDDAIDAMLRDAEEASRAGLDDGVDEALRTAGQLAEEDLSESMDRARVERTPEAIDRLLEDAAEAELLGADDQVDAALELTADIIEEIEEKTEAKFREKPTVKRFEVVLERLGDANRMGRLTDKDWLKGVVRRRPAGEYVVRPNDTLSKIAVEFYGDPSLWGYLWLYNYGAIGDNPNLILPGTVLKIP